MSAEERVSQMTAYQVSTSPSAIFAPCRLSPSLSSSKNGLVPELSPGRSEIEGKKRRRALIVDDVTDVTDMLSVLLRQAGYEVATAESATAALRRARDDHFDIVISDIGMPDMDGYELARALRTLPGYEVVPIVAVTGYAMFNDRERSLQSGFVAHITKPIDPLALLDLIEQL
jgi:CheY-like chemotaxis protein